jgi:hypothetical protein
MLLLFCCVCVCTLFECLYGMVYTRIVVCGDEIVVCLIGHDDGGATVLSLSAICTVKMTNNVDMFKI